MRILFYILGIVSFAHFENISATSTVLSKIFHNTGQSDDVHKSVQLGGITFVFSDDLVVNQLPLSHDTVTKLRFFIPDGVIQSSIKTKDEIVSPQENLYKVKMSVVTSPKNGIQFDVEYDPARIIFTRDIFQRVTRERKLVFHFYDKQLLDKIKANIEVPMIMQASLNPSVFIDCGHGGHDFGVIGCAQSAEKNICLAVGMKVADRLKKKGISVKLTRDQDVYVSLDQRVHDINKINPHLLVSIHANAAGNKNVSGIETFYFDPVECREFHSENFIKQAFIEVHQKELTLKNKQLARVLQQAVCKSIEDNKISVVDRKIKSEPLQLLMGVMAPAVLMEIGFLTNEQEANLLLRKEYQQLVAKGICKGIISFMGENTKLHTS